MSASPRLLHNLCPVVAGDSTASALTTLSTHALPAGLQQQESSEVIQDFWKQCGGSLNSPADVQPARYDTAWHPCREGATCTRLNEW